MTILFGTRATGLKNRRALDLGTEAPYFKSEWMEGGEDPWLSPTIFLVEQPPGSVLPAHFHRQNEFQVVVEGEGAIGIHRMTPVAVHYAGAYTGYGPVVAGPAGLSYFTIRPVLDSGALLASEARQHMIRGPKRQVHAVPVALDSLPPAGARPVEVTVIPAAADGLHSVIWQLPAGSVRPVRAAAGTAGAFCLVLQGRVEGGGQPLEVWESAYLSADEDGFALTAGAEGAVVLYMQVPATEPEYLPSRQA